MNSAIQERLSPQLAMAKIHLDDLPPLQLDAGYTSRHFAPGDEAGWNALVSASFGRSYDFDVTMRADHFFQPERVWFIEHAGKLVATASAWRGENWGKNTGVIHMVAASPEHRGHQLGYQISLAALHQFVREDVHHAVLQTDDDRLPAIVTYIKLGFSPLLIHVNQAARWEKIYRNLKQL